MQKYEKLQAYSYVSKSNTIGQDLVSTRRQVKWHAVGGNRSSGTHTWQEKICIYKYLSFHFYLTNDSQSAIKQKCRRVKAVIHKQFAYVS